MSEKKIFYITNVLLPNTSAHGIQIMNMCKALSDNGMRVTLVVPAYKKKSVEEIKRFYNIESSFSVKQISVLSIGTKQTKLNFYLRWFSFTVWLLWTALKGKFNGAIVYTRGEMVLSLALIPRKLNMCWETHIKPDKVSLYRWAIKRCSKLVVVTLQYKKELISEFGVPEEDVLTEPDAVVLENFDIPLTQKEAREKLGLPCDRKIIVYTGSDLPWKGLGPYKEAATYLEDKYLVTFVGKISPLHQGDKRVRYIGYVGYKEIPLWLRAADFLLLTGSPIHDESQKYTSPLKLFEYMASGTPLIATDIASFREVLNDDLAIFIDAQDPKEIAVKIMSIDGKCAKDKSERAYELVLDHTWQKRAKRICAFLSSVDFPERKIKHL